MSSEKKRFPLPRRRLPFILENRWGRRVLLLAAFVAPVAIFIFWQAAREAALTRMGLGLVPAILWLLVLALALRYRPQWALKQWRGWLGGAFLVAASMGIMSLFELPTVPTQGNSLGGQWGQLLGGYPLYYGAPKVFGLLTLASLALLPRLTLKFYGRLGEELLAFVWLMVFAVLRSGVLLFRYIRERMPTFSGVTQSVSVPLRRGMASLGAKLSLKKKVPTWRDVAAPRERTPDVVAEEPEEPDDGESSEPESRAPETEEPAVEETARHQAQVPEEPRRKEAAWALPPVELLDTLSAEPIDSEVLQEIAQRIERTLGEHGLEVKVESVRPGPRVVLFGLALGWMRRHANGGENSGQAREVGRVKVDSIMAREKDLALALKTPSIRLLAPVPGEQMVGIEVPNPKPNFVPLRVIVESPPFDHIARSGGFPVALGEGPGGEPVAIDLKEMPHLLLAGATGSGKSICINSTVCSLILTRSPRELRFLMVDPKRVELTPFNGIPHLLMPVVVDTDRVVPALQGVLTEMFRRYRLMEETGARSIDTYNRRVPEPLPHLVIVIDELADLMMAAAYEVEQSLVRLAQLGRATGVHLVLATQRPSVNVVTGLMKANIPARIAFNVASQVDSRVILDSAGAEKLLGKGDLLFLSPSDPKPHRIQGSYVSDKEIERLVLYWKSQRGPAPSFSLEGAPTSDGPADDAEGPGGNGTSEGDRLLNKAREVAARYKRLSPSVLQRRLRIGYPKALQLIELLEEEGTVAPGDPGTSRPVLLNSGGKEELS